ncbi:MAG TPA: translocation/assembly module TamB domain-containing protein, partial [Chitinophagales bacterium]|nr:translocation/assembly module TamB domain-containing protein [Chitinophagales bacterium]
MFRKIGKAILIVLLVFGALTLGLVVALRSPGVQTFLAQRFTAILSKSLNTKVSIERVELKFFNNADLVNFYLEDHNQDTLIAAKELTIKFKVFDLFDKKIAVSRVFLDGAVVHLHRDTAGVTNIADLFKSFASNKVKEDTTKTRFTWNMDLKQLDLQQTDFRYFDEKGYLDIKVYVPSCVIDLNDVSLEKKLINIATAKLDGTQVGIDLLKRPKGPVDTTIMQVQFMVGDMKVKFDDFALTDTRFRLDDHNNDTVLQKGMDFKHLLVTDINLTAENGSIVADSVLAKLTHLEAKERSGFQLLDMTTDARVSTKDITLTNLDLKTPNSEIKNFLSFRFNAYHDFKDFINAMRVTAHFTDTKLSLKDLNYFVRSLDKVAHNQFTINGEIDGRVNNLKGRGLDIRGGNSTVFKGDFYTRGLPDIYETSLNVRVSRLSTTAADLRRFYPALKLPPNFNSLGTLYYTGSLDGFVTDFVSNGKLTTSIGSATTDVNFKYDKKRNKASYKGNLALNSFDLGKYFNDEVNLGKVSLNGKIDGGGLTMESLHANLEGSISSITLRGYEYKDLQVNGYVLRKSFNGLLQIHDEYLDMDFNGRADLSKAKPEFRFDADIRRAALKNLNLTKEDFRVSGKIKSDFIGIKVDDIVGSVTLRDVLLFRDTLNARVKNLTLDVKLLAGQNKEIKLNSDFAEGEMTGNFTFTQLPKALLAFARYTFTKDYSDTSYIAPQDFALDVRIFEPGNLTRIIHPSFYMIRNSHIQGSFNSREHEVKLTATVPQLKFGGYDARRIDVAAAFKKGDIDFRTVVDKVYGKDSLMMDTVSIVTKTQENKDIRFDVMVADKRRFNYANITAYLTPLVGKAVVRLEPSDIKLANYNWKFLPDNQILIEGKKVTTRNLVFKTEDQTIYIASYLKNDTSTSLKLTLDNTDVGDFTGIFTQKMKDLKGAMNGKLIVEDVFYKPKVVADFVVNDFTLGNQLIGDINIESSLDDVAKKLNVYASVKSVNNFLEAKGYISVDPAHPGLDIDVKAPKLGLNFLNYKFFERYVKDCRGYARIDANVHGTLNKPLLSGNVILTKDTVTVSFLNTTYHITELDAKLDDHGFNFGSFSLYDIKNNIIYASGRINHESFRKFALDLNVTTPNAQFLNTTARQSPNFYGVAYGAGNVTFKGDIGSPVIRAYAKTKEGTHCNIPVSSSYETNRYTFYKFTDPNKDYTTIPTAAPQLKLNGVNFLLDLDATSDARMDIILDPVSGDMLTTYGHGSLQVEIPKAGGTTVKGDYEIDRGNYMFTLQSVVNKRFELTRGTIHFSGDIYKAGINVDAT